MDRVLLRRPSSIAPMVSGIVLIAFGSLFGLAGLAAAGPPGLALGAFALVGAGMIWWSRVSGLLVTAGTDGSVVLVNGIFRRRICARSPVASLSMLRVGTVWDDHEEIRFLDASGGVLGQVVNLFPSRYSPIAWTEHQVREFANQLQVPLAIDMSDSHLTHPPPRYADDDE